MKRFLILSILLLNSCYYSWPGQPVLESTTAPEIESPHKTKTPQDSNFTECGFVWARESIPDLSKDFQKALHVVQPEATGYAEAYGENCVTSEGAVVRFLALETDFYVTLKVMELEDKQKLGILIEQVLHVISDFPVEETPGPQSGYVEIAFEAPEDELHLWFTLLEAETARKQGLTGKELFQALQMK